MKTVAELYNSQEYINRDYYMNEVLFLDGVRPTNCDMFIVFIAKLTCPNLYNVYVLVNDELCMYDYFGNRHVRVVA